MITPQFSVDQNDEFVFIKITAPHIKAANIEFVVDENVFIFSLHPYYLRLRFPGKLVDDDEQSSADYDLSTSVISVKLPKETKGEQFEDLDMISRLLARKNEDAVPKPKPMIVELDGTDRASELASAEDFDWEIEQQIPAQTDELSAKYGFDNGYSNVMSISVMNGNDINDLSDADKLSPQQRTQERIELENDKFDADYYLSDLFDNPMIDEVVNWNQLPVDDLSSQEIDRLSRLSNKNYLLDSPKQTYIGLISLIFAYSYDVRTNVGDTSVESPWTIGKLSPILSCLDANFTSVEHIMVCCSRRALCYPLYRSWDLIVKVWDDVYEVLKRGKKGILKILVKLVIMFDIDIYSVYNQIWLQDYAVWIQYSQENVIRSLAKEVQKVSLTKESMDLDLIEYEEAANEAITEQEMDQVD